MSYLLEDRPIVVSSQGKVAKSFKTSHLSCKWPWAWNPISLMLSVFLWKKGILIKTSSSRNPGKLNEISSTLAISRWWLIEYYYEYWNIHIFFASYPGLVWFLKKQPLKRTYCKLETTEAVFIWSPEFLYVVGSIHIWYYRCRIWDSEKWGNFPMVTQQRGGASLWIAMSQLWNRCLCPLL